MSSCSADQVRPFVPGSSFDPLFRDEAVRADLTHASTGDSPVSPVDL